MDIFQVCFNKIVRIENYTVLSNRRLCLMYTLEKYLETTGSQVMTGSALRMGPDHLRGVS